MKEFIVEINGTHLVKRKATTPRIAASEALKRHPEFGMSWNGGRDRQLRQGEKLYITVSNRKDRPDIRFEDER